MVSSRQCSSWLVIGFVFPSGCIYRTTRLFPNCISIYQTERIGQQTGKENIWTDVGCNRSWRKTSEDHYKLYSSLNKHSTWMRWARHVARVVKLTCIRNFDQKTSSKATAWDNLNEVLGRLNWIMSVTWRACELWDERRGIQENIVPHSYCLYCISLTVEWNDNYERCRRWSWPVLEPDECGDSTC